MSSPPIQGNKVVFGSSLAFRFNVSDDAWAYVRRRRANEPPESVGGSHSAPVLSLDGELQIQQGSLALFPESVVRLRYGIGLDEVVSYERPEHGFLTYLFSFALALLRMLAEQHLVRTEIGHAERFRQRDSGLMIEFLRTSTGILISADLEGIPADLLPRIEATMSEFESAATQFLVAFVAETEAHVPEAFDWPVIAPLKEYLPSRKVEKNSSC